MELINKGINNNAEELLPCFYKGQKLEKFYRMDIVVGNIVIELKATRNIISSHRAQLFNYLRITKKPIGLLINFGKKKLQGERYAYNERTNECYLLDKDMNILHPEYAEDEERIIDD